LETRGLLLASNNYFDILNMGLRAALTKDFFGVNRRGPIKEVKSEKSKKKS